MSKLDVQLRDFLLLLDSAQCEFLLKDLKDEEKRTPALYTAINRVLARHEFTIKSVAIDESILGELGEAVQEALKITEEEMLEDDLYGPTGLQ